MARVREIQSMEFFTREIVSDEIVFTADDYERRLTVLRARMGERGYSHALIFGDREHFSNIEYFTGTDCRFEEMLLVVPQQGSPHILVGNEGVSQTFAIRYPITLHLYQTFSLQSQPRDKVKPLREVLSDCGLDADSFVGLAGYKYFEPRDCVGDPDTTYDLPAYIVEAVHSLCAPGRVRNMTRDLTGFPDGIRTRLVTAKEIAWAEAAGNCSASVVLRMLKRLKPGISEIETGNGVADLRPVSVHPMINFGPEKVRIGVGSPTSRILRQGEVAGVCYGVRGSLTSRVGIAAQSESRVAPELIPYLPYYRQYWLTIAEILSEYRVGLPCARIHEIAANRLGDPKYHVVLNATHYTGTEEWLNAPVYKDSPYVIGDGSHIQIDLIVSNPDPVFCCICEDAVVIASADMREELAQVYPQVYARIQERQSMIREVLGIPIHDDLLPMSNLVGVYFPYMLDLQTIFALRP